MPRKRDGLVPIGEALADLGGPVKAIRDASPQALHHFTQADQVNQLVSASEADPDLGFMARLMALCSLPRTNPGNQKEYIRCNGPYTLGMTAGLNCQGRREIRPLRRSKTRPVGGVVAVFVGRLERSLRAPFRATQA